MKIHSNKLQRIFKYLTPSMGSNLKMPEYSSFLFYATENELMVRAYNGTIETVVKMNGQFEPLKFAVDEFIYQVVNHLTGDINFELDGTVLLVNCANKHYDFATVDCETWIPIVQTSPANEPFDLENVKKFNKAKHCVATDESRPIYTNYHIRDGQLFASDGFRAITIPTNLSDCSLPQKETDSILRCLDGVAYYKFDDVIYFKCENEEFVVSYMTSGVEGEPFDPTKIFAEKENVETSATIEFTGLAKRLKDVEIMQKQALKMSLLPHLKIFVKDGKLYFFIDVAGLSTVEEEIETKFDGGDFELNLNPAYLMDYAKVADGVITMKVPTNKMEPVLLFDESDAKSLIMPMNIK